MYYYALLYKQVLTFSEYIKNSLHSLKMCKIVEQLFRGIIRAQKAYLIMPGDKNKLFERQSFVNFKGSLPVKLEFSRAQNPRCVAWHYSYM